MDTYMDTKIAIVFPFYFSEIIVDDNIVSTKGLSRFMTGDGHEGEMIVSGKIQILDWAMIQIMQCHHNFNSSIHQRDQQFAMVPDYSLVEPSN